MTVSSAAPLPGARSSEPRTLGRAIYPYVATVTTVAAGVLSWMVARESFGWISRRPTMLIALVTATVLAEMRPLHIPRGKEAEDVTLSTTFAYALVLVWGALAGGLAMIISSFVAGVARRRPAWKSGFNAAQYLLSIAAAAAAVEWVTGRAPGPALEPHHLPAVLFGGAVFFIVNNTLVATAIALAQNRPIIAANVEGLTFQALTTAAVVALTPILVISMAWSPFVLPLLLTPIVAVYAGGLATAERMRSEDRFRAMAQNAADVVAVLDGDGILRYVSPSVRPILGFEPEALIGTGIFEVVHHDERQKAKAMLSDLVASSGKVTKTELRVFDAHGGARHFDAVLNNLLDNESVGGIVLNARDVTERKVLEQELEHQAFHDPLTGLANRALLRDRVQHALTRSERDASQLAVLFFDLDDFKTINDSLGHAVGDEVLSQVATRLHSCLRPGDTAARLGGDEFAVLLEPAGRAAAVLVARRFLEAIATPFTAQQREIAVRASIGVAVAPAGEWTTDEFLRNADVAMYAAKGQGKARYEVYEPDMSTAAVERVELEADLRRALENDELFLHYQPIVALEDGRLIGVEALVRWQHPRRGVISPASFVSLAEDTGLIGSVGRVVLTEACRQGREWASNGSPIRINVNISAKQLQRPDLVDEVAEVLNQTGFDPSLLVFEITESTVMRDAVESLLRLEQLRKLGVSLAIDDFGTGYSSLSYLKRFPIDVLKIDKSFVDGLTGGAEESALVRAIVQIGRTLRLRTVAEGIESADQLAELLRIGCDAGQGYYFSPPVPAHEISAMLMGPSPLTRPTEKRYAGVRSL